jgi:hypothetical protein
LLTIVSQDIGEALLNAPTRMFTSINWVHTAGNDHPVPRRPEEECTAAASTDQSIGTAVNHMLIAPHGG